MKPVTKVVIGGSLLILSGYDVWRTYSYEPSAMVDSSYQSLYAGPAPDLDVEWEQPKQPVINVDEILATAGFLVYWYSRPIVPAVGVYLTASGIKALRQHSEESEANSLDEDSET